MASSSNDSLSVIEEDSLSVIEEDGFYSWCDTPSFPYKSETVCLI